MATDTVDKSTNVGVITALVVNCVEVVGLGVAAWITGSTALRAQTAVNAADAAVVLFLLEGVLSSARGPDERHPLGHGRERFFWSLFAAPEDLRRRWPSIEFVYLTPVPAKRPRSRSRAGDEE